MKLTQMSAIEKERLSRLTQPDHNDGLSDMLRRELSYAVFEAMQRLKLRYRSILILRCLEQKSYSEIADIMDCSELAAKALFFRAKHLLKRKLSKHGFGGVFLLLALGIFAKVTAPADAAQIGISAASTKVGLTAAVIGAAGTKLGLIISAIITAAALIVGTGVSLDGVSDFIPGGDKFPQRADVKSFHYVEQAWDKKGSPNPNIARGRSLSKGAYEQWYYFPEGVDGTMFMMMQRWDPQQENKLCGWLQNRTGNYYYYSGGKTIYLYDYHLPMRYLTTRRLPSDSPEFTEFLDEVEGKTTGIKYTRDPKTGLLLGVLDNRFYNAQNFRSSFSYNKLNEKFFESYRYTWPESTPVIDQRDEMHKRGWTYFRITGQINDQQVRGCGQIPFIYDALAQHQPWLKLNVAGKLKIIDSPSMAYLTTDDDKAVASYTAGSFFKGLARPWMGMHAIDIIRRDAAEKRVRFATENFGGDDKHYGKAKISMSAQAIRIDYTVDIDKDIIEKIEFFESIGSEAKKCGFLEFTHLEKIEESAGEFAEPEKIKVPREMHHDSIGMLWLIELVQGTLGQ